MMARAVVGVLLLAAAGCGGGAPAQAIVGATLMDGTPDPPVADAVVVVRHGRIAALGPRAATPVPEGAARIAGEGRFVFPLEPDKPLVRGGPADLLLLAVNPAADPDYESKVVGRMVNGLWVKFPR
jgi:imidazolonepropionase-like amidohydrolase